VPLLRGDDLRQFSFAHFLLLVVVVLLLLAARAFTLVVALFELVSLSLYPLRGVVPLLRGDDLRQFSFAHFLLLVVVVLLLLAARAFTLVVALFELVSLSL
jgi:hypothetical protein